MPLRAIVCGLLAALSTMRKLAVRWPFPAGVNVTGICVDCAGATVMGKVALVNAYSVALVPISEILEITRLSLPVLLTVST